MPTGMVQKPICLALVLSDAIWIDPATGKRTILGTFSVLWAPDFPAQHAQLAVYAGLTDGIGQMDISIRIIDVDEEREPVAESVGHMDFTDPRMVLEIAGQFVGVVFPTAGEYRVQLLAGGDLLMERRLLVLHAAEQENA